MTLDLGPAFTRAQTVVNGLVASIPSILVALLVFGVFWILAAVVKRVVARLTEAPLHIAAAAGRPEAVRVRLLYRIVEDL